MIHKGDTMLLMADRKMLITEKTSRMVMLCEGKKEKREIAKNEA
jgi:hypothetical protein